MLLKVGVPCPPSNTVGNEEEEPPLARAHRRTAVDLTGEIRCPDRRLAAAGEAIAEAVTASGSPPPATATARHRSRNGRSVLPILNAAASTTFHGCNLAVTDV